ncbi:MAG: SH3 domain-containing protein [Ardenticatenaceae bacterium]|nr:SH3 domain-containing protein [Ardenticatenaceae bacterium]
MAQLYQNDPRWANQKIGLQSSLTISQVGCLLTSMAMVVNHYGGSTTPAALNDLMKSRNGFSGAWVKSAQVPSAFPQLGMQRQKHVESGPMPMDLIDQGLAAGSLIVVRVDWSADPGIQGHWVVLYKKEGNDYLIWDPWDKQGASNKLTERYGFASKDPSKIILEAIWHGKGDFPPAATASAPAPSSSSTRKNTPTAKQATGQSTGPVAVKPKINQLSLRQQPVSGTIVKLLSPSDVLLLIEGGEAAAKIGQQGQWLQVRLSDNTEGYVAAWYVEQTEAPIVAPSPPSAPSQPSAPAASGVAVKTKVDQVSLRSQPRVANDTFMSTLPTGTALTAIEADAAAKIGQQGQWLQVRTSGGQEGYVAAWLVAKA